MMLETTRTEMLRTAPIWQPQWLAVVCLASAAMLVYTTVFPVVDGLDLARRFAGIVAALGAGTICSVLASRFRVWMVHAVVVAGLVWTVVALARTDSPMVASLTMVVLLWFGIFVGAAFRPKVTRIYAGAICLGIFAGLGLGVAVPDGGAIGIAFGGSFIVIMEIMTRTTSQLRREATTDYLTGLLNRTGLKREVKRVRNFRRDDRIAVLVADLDGFKEVNDRQGHQAGDQTLRSFARAWREDVRVGDIVARIGGDEFVVVFPEVGEADAQKMVERLRRSSPFPWSGGLVIAGPDESIEECIARADRGLYREKQAKGEAAAGQDPAGASGGG